MYAEHILEEGLEIDVLLFLLLGYPQSLSPPLMCQTSFTTPSGKFDHLFVISFGRNWGIHYFVKILQKYLTSSSKSAFFILFCCGYFSISDFTITVSSYIFLLTQPLT
jgi:hypothetical protein